MRVLARPVASILLQAVVMSATHLAALNFGLKSIPVDHRAKWHIKNRRGLIAAG
jgi:hypothetical protein